MDSAQRSFWRVLPVVAIMGLFIFASREGGPNPAVSAPMAITPVPQVRMYLRVDGVQGELTDDPHKGCLEVQAYEHQPHIWGDPHVTEGGKPDDLRAFRLTVSRPVNKVTPALLLQYCQQTPIPTVTLELWREDGSVPQKTMVYTHHDCALNAIRNMKGLAADDSPTEELTFVCSAMEWAWTEHDENGTAKPEVRTQWDTRVAK